MSATPAAATTPAAPAAPSKTESEKCAYCSGTGRWSKEVFLGKPEMVYCPHCHGSGNGGSPDSME